MKKLAIIGASYLQKPLVLKAKEMNIETHCFAWEEGAVCQDIVDFFYPISVVEKEIILDKCIEIGINGITSIASDVAVSTVCYVAEKMNLTGNPYKNAIVTTNKYQMRQRLVENGVKSPRFTIANSSVNVMDFRLPLIVKPTDRSGSRGVRKINNFNEIESAVMRAKAESFFNEAIIEEFISGREISVESISWQGQHYIIAITDKITTGEPYFVELEHHQPSDLNVEIQDKIKLQTIKALDALEIKSGASHSEFKITEDGEVYAIEIGARMGGDFIGSDLVRLSTGYDFLKAVIDVSLGSFEIPQMKMNKYSGVYFLSKETENVKKYIDNSVLFSEIVISEITDFKLHEVQSSCDRSGYFIYQSDKRMTL